MILNDDVVVVVVLYNPSLENINNIKLYAKNEYTVYAIDNSSIDNSNFFENNDSFCYIPNYENLGIAKALNIAFNKAFLNGFKWVLTMDQDSKWNSIGELNAFISECMEINKFNPNCVSFGPKIEIPLSKVIKVKQKLLKKTIADIENVDCLICSGNLLKTSVWKEVGGFTENLFIDEVDFDFCFKLREKNYYISRNNKYCLCHFLGDNQRETLFPQDFHNQNRLYYMIRNRLYVMKLHPYYAKRNKYKKDLLILIIQKLLFSDGRWNVFKIISRAYKDYKKLLPIDNYEGISGK